MKDEEFLFYSDSREKKNIARSARNKRIHNGKGGRVKLPSDYKTRKEIQAMNGEVKSYRLNEPMSWREFKTMPDDIKITYIKLLREKYNVPGRYIAEMMGVNTCSYSQEINRLGISEGKNCRGRCTPWDREGFYAWRSGISLEETVETDEQQENETLEAEQKLASLEVIGDPVPVAGFKVLPVREDKPKEIRRAIPGSGGMTFEGRVDDVLNSVSAILGDSYVHIRITWNVVKETTDTGLLERMEDDGK